jgi:hypothetical protein
MSKRGEEEEEEEEEKEKKKKKKKKKKGSLLLARAGLSSCLYMLCAMCVHLSMLRVISTLSYYAL